MRTSCGSTITAGPMPAYVPPALRGSGAPPAARQQERIWTVRLSFSHGGPYKTDECPQQLIAAPAAPPGPHGDSDTVSVAFSKLYARFGNLGF